MIASLVILLHLCGAMSAQSAFTSLYIVGAVLFIAEIGVVSFGLLSVNALLAIYAAYSIQNGATPFFQLEPEWPMLFGIAFLEILIIISIIFVYRWIRSRKITTGVEAMIGQKATVLSWDNDKGEIRYEGEIWKARSDTPLEISAEDIVTITATDKLLATITK